MCQEVPLSHSPSSSLKAIERYLPRAFDTEKMIHFFGEVSCLDSPFVSLIL